MLPSISATSVCVPKVSHSHPSSTSTDSPRPADTKLLLCPWSFCTKDLCVPFKSENSVIPVLWSSSSQTLLAFKAWCSASPFLVTDPWARGLMGSEMSFLWENLCNNYASVCGPPTARGYGIWLYHESTPPIYLFFGRFQHFSRLKRIVFLWIVIFMCMWEEVHLWSFCSAIFEILSQNFTYNCFFSGYVVVLVICNFLSNLNNFNL